MIYQFKCNTCDIDYEVFRSVKESSEPMCCPACNNQMQRIYTVPHTIIKQSNYYHMGLGKQITNNADVKDEYKKYKDRTGKEIIELGNEKLPEVKPKTNYELSHQETREVHRILESAGVPE